MNQKECSKCKNIKNINEFHFKKSEGRYQSWCKCCIYEKQKLRWKDLKRRSVELMGGCCSICGYKKNLASLHFHHIDPLKKDVSWNKLRLRKWSSIVKELKKCMLICANCHGELHSPETNLIIESQGHDNIHINTKNLIFQTGICPSCNTPVYGTKYCSIKCAKIGNRKVERPSKDDLKNLLSDMSYCAIGRKYGVSDNAIRKWAKKYELI